MLPVTLPAEREACYDSFPRRLRCPSTRVRRVLVAKKKAKAVVENGRPPRRKLSAEESLQRMKEFDRRKEAFIAALRKSKDRGVSP